MTLVLVPAKLWQESCADLAEQATVAARRYRKALPGERREGLRVDALCEQLESRAEALAHNGLALAVDLERPALVTSHQRFSFIAPGDGVPAELREAPGVVDHVAAGGAVVELIAPLDARATTVRASAPVSALAPAEPAAEAVAVAGRRELWEHQLEAAARGSAQPIVPSGVGNEALAAGLRRFADAGAVPAPQYARVLYRDGSEARPFPLGAVRLNPPAGNALRGVRVLRTALISMRHPEMDADVDAALLRNRIVSQLRPAAETDGIAHAITLQKLAALRRRGPIVLEVFQTGLEPAVIGFYRALVEHLAQGGGELVVRPMHYRRRHDVFEPGLLWSAA